MNHRIQKGIIVGILAVILALIVYSSSSQNLLTGFATANTSKYADLFEAAGEDAAVEPLEEDTFTPQSEPTLSPQAIIKVDACFKASTHVPAINPADTVIVNTSQINATGTSPCIELDVGSITFDCNGSTLKGTQSQIGINLSVDRVTIQNCTARNFTTGILAQDAAGGLVDNFIIRNSNIYQNTGDGIRVNTSTVTDKSISNAVIHSNGGRGIYLKRGAGTDIENSTFENNTQQEIYIGDNAGNNFDILGNNLSDFTHRGADHDLLNFENNSDIRINNNRFTNYNTTSAVFAPLANKVSLFPAPAVFSQNIQVRNNTFDNLYVGAYLTRIRLVDNLTFVNNTYLKTLRPQSLTGLPLIEATTSTGPIRILENSFNGTLNVEIRNALVRDNTFEERDTTSTSFRAILMQNSYRANITNNNASMIIELGSSSIDCIATDNNLRNNGRIDVKNCRNCDVMRNTLNPVAVEGTTSAGIEYDSATNSGDIINNTLANGQMFSIKISGENHTVSGNTLENATGDAIVITGINVTAFNNTIYNMSGPGFRLNGTNITAYDNNITYIIRLDNTSYNLRNVSTPQIPISYEGFLVEPGSTGINITNNDVRALNPHGLRNGIYGVRTRGQVQRLFVIDNTFTDLRTGVRVIDSPQPTVTGNTINDAEHNALEIQNVTQATISDNSLTGTTLATDPYEYAVGMYVLRSVDNDFSYNNMSKYHIGTYVHNSSRNRFLGERIVSADPTGIGILSFLSIQNNYTRVVINNAYYGVKLLYSNYSNFSQVNATSANTGFSLYQAHHNYFGQCNATSNTIGIEFDLFSSNNTANNNDFSGSTDVDVLFDMYAEDNTGIGNGGPTTRSENGAKGNSIT